jgi:glycosyltransferase 2 family protein
MPEQIGASTEDLVLVDKLKLYGGALGAIAATSLGVFFVLVDRGVAARGTFARILTPAPPPVQRVFLKLFDGFLEGLGSTRDRVGLLQAGVLSLAIWFNGAAAIYCLFLAFELPLSFSAACFTAVAIAIAVVVPQAPGFLGTFHVVIEKTLVLWAVAATPAAAYAIVFWAVSFVPVTVAGLLALWHEGLTLGGLWQSVPTRPDLAE